MFKFVHLTEDDNRKIALVRLSVLTLDVNWDCNCLDLAKYRVDTEN